MLFRSGIHGPVTLSVAWNGIGGTSKPIRLECRPPRSPILDRPKDGTRVTEEILYAWHPVPGAISYTFELADHPGFASPLFTEDAVPSSSFAAPEAVYDDLEVNKTYYWRVRASNACGPGRFSEARRFVYQQTKRASFRITSPRNGETLSAGSPYVVRWDCSDKVGSTLRIVLKIPGEPLATLASSVPVGSGTFVWTVPPGARKRCWILIESEQDPRIRTLSGQFSIR